MKLFGLILLGFGVIEGVFMVDGEVVMLLICDVEVMLVFFYLLNVICVIVDWLWIVMFKWFVLYYVVKVNFYVLIFKLFNELVDGFDIVFGGEFVMVWVVGIDFELVSFVGLGKCDDEFVVVIIVGVMLNFEFEGEVICVLGIVDQLVIIL